MEPWQQASNPFVASSLAYTTFFLRCVSVEEEGTLFFVDNSTETLLRDQLSMLPTFEASYVHIRASHFGSFSSQQLQQQHCSAIFPWPASVQQQHQQQEQRWFFCRTRGKRGKRGKRLKSRLQHTSLAAYTKPDGPQVAVKE